VILSPKIFLDECVAHPIAVRLVSHYSPAHPSIEVRHLFDEYRKSRCDSVWVPNLARQGGWIVITKDRGKHTIAGKVRKPRLPELCVAYGVTCVTFTGKLGHAKATEIQEAIDEVMRNIEPIYAAPAGTIIKIGMDFAKGNIKRYVLRVGQRSLGSFLEGPATPAPKAETAGQKLKRLIETEDPLI
jgi:PIN domain-containing protein